MSTRFESANSEYAGRNAVAVGTAPTFGGYFYLHSLPSSGQQGAIITLYKGAPDFVGWSVVVASDGKLHVVTYNGVTDTAGTTVLSTGVWYYLWIRQQSNADNVLVYLNDSTTPEITGAFDFYATPARVEFATSQVAGTNRYLDCSLDAWKGWSIDRAASNAATEDDGHALVSSTSAVAAWYLDGTDVTDHSGTGNDLTANGTLSAGPDSPIDSSVTPIQPGYIPGLNKAPAGAKGPRDRLGFLRQQVFDYTIAVVTPTTASGDGSAFSPSLAYAAGAAIATGSGASVSPSLAAGAGVAIAAGSGMSLSPSLASGGGAATASGNGASLSVATTQAPPLSIASAAGNSLGLSVAYTPLSLIAAGNGVTLGLSFATAPTLSIASGSGTSLGFAISYGSAQSVALSGSALSVSSAYAAGSAIAAASGSSSGLGLATGQPQPIAAAVGYSLGLSSIVAPSASIAAAIGSSISPSFAYGMNASALDWIVLDHISDAGPTIMILSADPTITLMDVSPRVTIFAASPTILTGPLT